MLDTPLKPTAANLENRAQICLYLSRAFLTPDPNEGLSLLQQDFVADMQALLAQAGRSEKSLHAFADSLAIFDDAEHFLTVYSRLFLVPPVSIPLNASVYLAGEMMAAPVDDMLATYRQLGLEKQPSFKDLPDHLAVQLEFIAFLYADAAETIAVHPLQAKGRLAIAERFMRVHINAWLPELLGRLNRAASESADETAFWRLGQLLAQMVAEDLRELAPFVADEKPFTAVSGQYRPEMELPEDEQAQLADIRARLEQAGLSTEHLQTNTAGLDGQLGLNPTKPVLPRQGKGSRAWQQRMG